MGIQCYHVKPSLGRNLRLSIYALKSVRKQWEQRIQQFAWLGFRWAIPEYNIGKCEGAGEIINRMLTKAMPISGCRSLESMQVEGLVPRLRARLKWPAWL